MRKIVIASHGYFSKGLVSSLEIIMGKQENIYTICGYIDDHNVEEEIEIFMKENQDNELIIFTDLLGGSINNIFLKYIDSENVYLIAGVNLAILIEIVNNINCNELRSRIKETIKRIGTSIVLCDKDYKDQCNPLSDF